MSFAIHTVSQLDDIIWVTNQHNLQQYCRRPHV